MKTTESSDDADLDDDDPEECLQHVSKTEHSETCPSIKVLKVQPYTIAVLKNLVSGAEHPNIFDEEVGDSAAGVHFSTNNIITVEHIMDADIRMAFEID